MRTCSFVVLLQVPASIVRMIDTYYESSHQCIDHRAEVHMLMCTFEMGVESRSEMKNQEWNVHTVVRWGVSNLRYYMSAGIGGGKIGNSTRLAIFDTQLGSRIHN